MTTNKTIVIIMITLIIGIHKKTQSQRMDTTKGPYNPYDPNDTRPPGGYPSEFKLQGQEPSGFSSLPKVLPISKVNETMERLNYTETTI